MNNACVEESNVDKTYEHKSHIEEFKKRVRAGYAKLVTANPDAVNCKMYISCENRKLKSPNTIAVQLSSLSIYNPLSARDGKSSSLPEPR